MARVEPEELSPADPLEQFWGAPYSLGVPDGHFQHELWWDLEELGVVAVGLEQQGQDIKAPVRSLPALLDADLQGQ